MQRFEVAGEVTDLRDPDARGTLLRVRPDGAVGHRHRRASGHRPPPKGPGLVGLALDATC